MSRRNRAGFNQYSRGSVHGSQLSMAKEVSHVSALNETLNVPVHAGVDLKSSAVADTSAVVVTTKNTPKNIPDNPSVPTHLLERSNMETVDHEAQTRRSLGRLLLNVTSAAATSAECLANMKALAKKTQSVEHDVKQDKEVSERTLEAMNRVIDVKTHFYNELDMVKEQLDKAIRDSRNVSDMLLREKEQTASLSTKLEQLQAERDEANRVAKYEAQKHADLQLTVDDMKAKLQLVQIARNDCVTQIDSLSGQVSSALAHNDDVLKEFTDLKSEYAQIDSDRKEIYSNVAGLAAKLKQYKTGATELHTKSEELLQAGRDLWKYKKEVKHGIEAYECKISKQHDIIRSLRRRVAELEGELNYKYQQHPQIKRQKQTHLELSKSQHSRHSTDMQVSVSEYTRSDSLMSSTWNRCAIM